jgi:hypothetical protein
MTGIPPELEKIFNRLQEEVMWLLVHWTIYDQLFNHSALRYKMMYECSPWAAYCIQNALETEILMSLSRLTDDPGSDDQERLSFQQFHAHLEQGSEKKLAEKLRSKMRSINQGKEPIREHRNARLAHLNRKIAMGEDPSPDPLSVELLEKAIQAFHDYMSTFQSYFEPDTEFRYDVPITYAGDALISTLQNGLRLREMIDEQKISPTERREGKWKDVLKEKSSTSSPNNPKIFPR